MGSTFSVDRAMISAKSAFAIPISAEDFTLAVLKLPTLLYLTQSFAAPTTHN
jgi:hypothetical protein